MIAGDPSEKRVVVIGAGIGGLTTAALLARRGYPVMVLDQAYVPGGCASTFKRRGFIFDVGATQVAGLEAGGIHQQIFESLGVPLPASIELQVNQPFEVTASINLGQLTHEDVQVELYQGGVRVDGE
ncbi:MAG: FAD-dependent oxidoreductase, partial [Leptolyngbya sp. SIO1D8]|nr:FAD-dependent oxidoreductase [Leptolyngbya sp. SIO1D8]